MAHLSRERATWWPGGIIPYVINEVDFPFNSKDRLEIQRAIDVWNTTAIHIVAHDTERNFVEFVRDSECQSAVGMQGGRQEISCNLGNKGFDRWSIVHEIGHAIGLYHEHQRNDRDNFVEVDWDNIKKGKQNPNYRRVKNGFDLCRYNYDSIMHYGDTLTKKEDGPDIGQRDHLSASEWSAVNYLYGTLSLRNTILSRKKSPTEGIARLLRPEDEGSVREWICCPLSLLAAGGGGF